ncbi:MliC family protein [Sphingomonas sp. G-3-2-10]|uniref:MliC family protein n=1 Tax=Sphingomonas sp. G-3-2-10 TaxID=2728838 RepID=UPI00146C0C6F|nr:MliC family protein [Sphingomonas sp. G-3-2-10]NML06980.1 lysozyme inhibitor [Sphingomonas sp. G-3-2-10]
MRLFLLLACLPLAACNASDDTRNPGADVYNLEAVDKEALDIAREKAAREAEEERIAEERAQAEANAAAENASIANATGATPAPSPAPVEDNRSAARFRCMDGTKIAVRFDPDNGRATVARGGKTLAVLQQERAASGIWYKGQGHELRGKGYDMTFTQPNLPPLACTTIR